MEDPTRASRAAAPKSPRRPPSAGTLLQRQPRDDACRDGHGAALGAQQQTERQNRSTSRRSGASHGWCVWRTSRPRGTSPAWCYPHSSPSAASQGRDLDLRRRRRGRRRGPAPRAERAGDRDHAHPTPSHRHRRRRSERVDSRDDHRRGEEHLADRREDGKGGGIRPGQGDSSGCLDRFDRTRQVEVSVSHANGGETSAATGGRSRRVHGHGAGPAMTEGRGTSDHRGEVAGHSGTGHRRPAPVAGEGSARRGATTVLAEHQPGGQHVQGVTCEPVAIVHAAIARLARRAWPAPALPRATRSTTRRWPTDGESDESDGRGIRHAGAIVVNTRRWAP